MCYSCGQGHRQVAPLHQVWRADYDGGGRWTGELQSLLMSWSMDADISTSPTVRVRLADGPRLPGTVGGVAVTVAGISGGITNVKSETGRTLTAEEKRRRQRNAKDLYLRRTYGISLTDYEDLLDKQDGRCAICLCKPRTRSLSVDHDHFTGAVRGLLCSRCNHGLLQFAQEDTAILRRAIEYLLKHMEGNRAVEEPPSTGGIPEPPEEAA